MIKQCKKCTYPLRERALDDDHKIIYCSNKQCDYERIIKRRHKWQQSTHSSETVQATSKIQ